MKKLLFTSLAILALGIGKADTDGFCKINNFCFKNGENVSLYVFYTFAGIWVHAGTAKFTANLETLNNKPVWHFTGTGETLSSYDWIYKVRDRYESYVDTQTMQPLKFIRSVDEGSYKKYENVTFNKTTNTAIARDGVFKTPSCIQDVISQVYYARNINYDNYKVDDKITFDIFLDNEVYHMYIRYLGKETIKTRYGKFKCIKFKPLLLKSSMFEGGEKMTVWIGDDMNRLPIRIESSISVGSVKVDMMMYNNIRYPLTSLIGIR
ncbi:MAG: DUF3108 domain-containing protein [Chitinophagaceae bacterium]